MPEYCVWRRNAAMTCERHVQTSAHTVSVNRGIHRGRKIRDGGHKRLAHPGELQRLGAGELGDFVEIGAHGENRSAENHQGTRFETEPAYRVGEGHRMRSSQAVHSVRRDEA